VLLVAVISGVFLLLGGGMTAIATHWSAHELADEQAEREDRRDLRDELRQQRAEATEARGPPGC
jgi:hypothetical protein